MTDDVQIEHDPKTALRLSTIQGVGLSIEQRIDEARQQVHVRQGVIVGIVSAEKQLIPKVMREVQALIDLPESDPRHLDGDAAKPILVWLQRAVEECSAAAKLNAAEKAKSEGIIEGLTKAVDVCEGLHKAEKDKAARRVSSAENPRSGRDEDGRPLPPKERFGDAQKRSPRAKKREA